MFGCTMPASEHFVGHMRETNMAMNVKQLLTTPDSATSLMLICGVLSLLASLAVAAVIWMHWNDLGVLLGPKSLLVVIPFSVVGISLAAISGLWALLSVEKFTGSNSTKCAAGFLLNALAMAIFGAFLIIAFLLKVSTR